MPLADRLIDLICLSGLAFAGICYCGFVAWKASQRFWKLDFTEGETEQ